MSSDDVVLQVRDLGKCYEIYDEPRHRLFQTLFRGRRKFYREFWALSDVSFEVKRGECLGIIGRNGGGKSTLLQIIAGTLVPTTGEVLVKGTVAALLELGSGFNPEFTGRENVYMNGMVLGLSRKELDGKFDDIAAFADIGEFINQPIKTYSSGMVLRLAFSVCTAIQPEILIVDEALAVGDAAFNAKCMKRFDDLLDRGTTIVLATHDLQTVRSKCSRAIFLQDGRIMADGDTKSVTGDYMRCLLGQVIDYPEQSTEDLDFKDRGLPRNAFQLDNQGDLIRWGQGGLRVRAVSINSHINSSREAILEYGQTMECYMLVEAEREYLDTFGIGFGMAFRNRHGLDVITSTTLDRGLQIPSLEAGKKLWITFRLHNILQPGEYMLVCNVEHRVGHAKPRYYDFIENALKVKVISDMVVYSLTLPTVEQTCQVLP